MWPTCMSKSSIAFMERSIESLKRSAEEMPTLLHADMVREAKQLENASRKLLRNLRSFEKNFSDAHYENHKRRADKLLTGLDADELETARIAYSQYSCQFVLLGLSARMRALQTPGKNKRRNFLGLWLKGELQYVFAKLNLPTGRTNDFMQALEYAIELSGIKASAESLVKVKERSVMKN